MRVIVLGAGINGLVCALKIKEKYPDVDVTILGSEFTPNTTGDGCGGLWYPYLCGTTPLEKISKWGLETYELLHKLWLEDADGISLVPVIELLRKEPGGEIEPEWTKRVFGYQNLDEKQMKYYNDMYSGNYVKGMMFTSFVVNPSKFLHRLEKKLSKYNVKRIAGSVRSLSDPLLSEYDVVINCTGLGSRDVVPDARVVPIRGQIARVEAPWNFYTLMDKDVGHYIIPNDSFCVLGGTSQRGDYNRTVVEEDKVFILNGCRNLLPALKNTTILSHFVGLRPGRDAVRLEAEKINGKVFIHNYGHGGSGFTLFWGCGNDVLELFEKNTGVGAKSKI